MRVGSAVAKRGELSYGVIEALELPSGLRETLPVIIAAGKRDGPTLWLTANIHGAELTGIAVIHRIVTAEICERLRVPALTLELGGGHLLDPAMIEAGVVAVRNGLRWAGLLDGVLEPVITCPVIHATFPLRREPGPRAPEPGLYAFRVREGSHLVAGDVAADLFDLWGRPVGEGVVRVKEECYLIGIRDGIVAYKGMPLGTLAVQDDDPLLIEEA